ncbi:hypothetical protein [Nocardia bovistercoris]|uniref:Uncharacterized protein n=1 Tax=Nocardia bovistercoris TaxID=2785916 RepID=A0A931I9U6_9NOCA|nr:hypothetical protein [Nocardia bovistercoris]MBH0777612.1 hypothetical protein [Nocardia bovistercoris]
MLAAEAALARTDVPAPIELGQLAWLAEFDRDDRDAAISELRDALVLTMTAADSGPLRETLRAWTTTAAVMRDPVRRAAHTGAVRETDSTEVFPPAVGDTER